LKIQDMFIFPASRELMARGSGEAYYFISNFTSKRFGDSVTIVDQVNRFARLAASVQNRELGAD
jgi:hypothetical protein